MIPDVAFLLDVLPHVRASEGGLSESYWIARVKNCLDDLEQRYRVAPHPFIATEAFLLAHTAAVPIPTWVSNWLHSGLAEFYQNQGRSESLQELLGFTSKQKTGTLFAAKARDERDENLAFHVLLLEKLCGIDRPLAKKLVLEKHNGVPGSTLLNPDTFDKILARLIPKVTHEFPEIEEMHKEMPDFPLSFFLRYVPAAMVKTTEGHLMDRREIVKVLGPLIMQSRIVTDTTMAECAERMLEMVTCKPELLSRDDFMTQIAAEISCRK